jgi:LacI family transcriptional regulator
MLAGHPQISAVFCANDLIALGLMTAAAQAGRVVGRDLSVAGFDDIFVAQLMSPALTTIRQPIAELGSQAARLAIGAIGRRDDPPERVVLPVELIARSSTAPALAGQEGGIR